MPEIAELERILGHTFADPALLERALAHGSYAYERGDGDASNERLEFLGDAVLDLVVSELLMEAHPHSAEGVLSRARADAVNTRALAERARALGLDSFVKLSRGEQRSGGSQKESILANVFEAVIGALYLDAGLAPVRALAQREIGAELSEPGGRADPKTRLQELLQSRGEPVPCYRVIEETGPAHARRFRCEVRAGDQVLGVGSGTSKRSAEQEAALQALAEDSA